MWHGDWEIMLRFAKGISIVHVSGWQAGEDTQPQNVDSNTHQISPSEGVNASGKYSTNVASPPSKDVSGKIFREAGEAATSNELNVNICRYH